MRYHDDAGGTLPVCMPPPSDHVTSQQAEALVPPPTYADAVAKPGVATGGQTTSAVTSQMDDANREATIAPVSAEPTAPADQVPYVALPVDHVPPAFEEEVEAAVLSPSPPTRSRTWMWAILFLHTVLVGLSVILVRVQVRESALSLFTIRGILPCSQVLHLLGDKIFCYLHVHTKSDLLLKLAPPRPPYFFLLASHLKLPPCALPTPSCVTVRMKLQKIKT